MSPAVPAILFDLGGVLIDWNPRYHYRTVFPEPAALESFLGTVCTSEWNRSLDAGRPFAEAIAERQAQWPQYAEAIGQWQSHWPAMLGGPIEGTVAVLAELLARELRVCALTNWSAETFPIAQARYAFLGWFERIVVSGEVGLAKPDPAIFRLALAQCGLEAAGTVFIDDAPENVAVARSLGLDAIRFEHPEQLRAALVRRGLLA